MSEHCPIYCQFNTKDIKTRTQVINNTTWKPSWEKASPEQKSAYKVTLQDRLNDLKITENINRCCNVHCKQGNHYTAIDYFLISLFENVQEVSNICLPSNRPFNETPHPPLLHDGILKYYYFRIMLSSGTRFGSLRENRLIPNCIQ